MRRKRPASAVTTAPDDDSQNPDWFLDRERAWAKSAEEMASRMQQTDRQLERIARQLQCNKEKLQSMNRFIAAKQGSDIRMLKAVARVKICQLTQTDFTATQDWDAYVQSLTSADCSMLRREGFTADAIQALKLEDTEKWFMGAACDQADSAIIAVAVADLPETSKLQHVELFDAVYGKHAFSIIACDLQAASV